MSTNSLNQISGRELAGLAVMAFGGIALFLGVIAHLWSISF